MENQVIVGLSMTVGRKRPYKILQLNVLNITYGIRLLRTVKPQL